MNTSFTLFFNFYPTKDNLNVCDVIFDNNLPIFERGHFDPTFDIFQYVKVEFNLKIYHYQKLLSMVKKKYQL